MSEETMKAVDQEVRRIIDEQYALARKLLEENRDKVEAMTKALLEWETIDADQIHDIMAGRPPRPPKPVANKPASPPIAARAARSRPRARPKAPDRARASDPRGGLGRPFSFHTSSMKTRVIGIVNVTADSFSDGGRFLDAACAIDHGRRLRDEGADLVDVGGESTRPGATPVALDEELRRVLPVVEALALAGIVVSVDTMKPEVMRRAIAAGAAMVNDVNAFRAPGAIEAVAPPMPASA
jgi:hypothetical protein